MTARDIFVIVGVLFNIGTYVALVWRNRKHETLVAGEEAWKFKAMWEDYKERKHIRANGGQHGR